MRRVLAAVTRLARAELLGEVNIVEGTRRGRLEMGVETRNTNTHEAKMWLLHWPSVQSQVVVIQLIRVSAIARAIRNRKGVSWYKMTVTKLAARKRWDRPARMTNFRVVNQPTLQSASWKPFLTKSSLSQISA